jgi:sulfiredoxin
MMRREKIAIADIYVPIKRRATLKPETVQEIARSILEVGLQAPILVRRDGERFVLVHGLGTGRPPTVCIASKRARHWAKRQSMDISSRP